MNPDRVRKYLPSGPCEEPGCLRAAAHQLVLDPRESPVGCVHCSARPLVRDSARDRELPRADAHRAARLPAEDQAMKAKKEVTPRKVRITGGYKPEVSDE